MNWQPHTTKVGAAGVLEGPLAKVSIQRHGYGYPDMVAQMGMVKAEADGTFRIDGLAPGLMQVSLFEYFPKVEGRGFGSRRTPPASAHTHLTVEAGKVLKVPLGGKDLAPVLVVPGGGEGGSSAGWEPLRNYYRGSQASHFSPLPGLRSGVMICFAG